MACPAHHQAVAVTQQRRQDVEGEGISRCQRDSSALLWFELEGTIGLPRRVAKSCSEIMEV